LPIRRVQEGHVVHCVARPVRGQYSGARIAVWLMKGQRGGLRSNAACAQSEADAINASARLIRQ
jgi:hypothetical protein